MRTVLPHEPASFSFIYREGVSCIELKTVPWKCIMLVIFPPPPPKSPRVMPSKIHRSAAQTFEASYHSGLFSRQPISSSFTCCHRQILTPPAWSLFSVLLCRESVSPGVSALAQVCILPSRCVLNREGQKYDLYF